VGLRLDQLQLRESHWVIVDLVGKGRRIRTVPVPNWCKGLMDVWLRHSEVSEGKVLKRVLKNGARQDGGVTANVVWYAVKRSNAVPSGPAYRIWHPTIFVAVAPASATDVEAN
jgi:integrase